jgi:serine/threonine protein kinase
MNRQPAEGDLLLQKYRLETCLGRGGMGRVWAARHQQLDRRVAIKVMHPELADRPELVARFVREGQAAARLRSPHIAQVLDVATGDTGACLVMEYLDGRDLEKLLREGGALPLETAVNYLLQVCEGVAEAHAAGIVHRDLKPANLFLTQDAYGRPSVKILDFGISKFSDNDSDPTSVAITNASEALGTPLYMAPEQMRAAHSAGVGADIWALGAIFYELVTGRTAWSGTTLSEICMQIATDPAPSVRSLSPALPREVDQVVETCLQKDPKLRYGSVLELVQALAALAPEVGAPAYARVARLVGSTKPPGSCRPLDTPLEHTRASVAGLATRHQRTNAAWGVLSEHPKPEPRRHWSASWKYVPALALCIAGGVSGVWWTQSHGTGTASGAPGDAADGMMAAGISQEVRETTHGPLVTPIDLELTETEPSNSLNASTLIAVPERLLQPSRDESRPARRAQQQPRAGSARATRVTHPVPSRGKPEPSNSLDVGRAVESVGAQSSSAPVIPRGNAPAKVPMPEWGGRK